MRKRKLMLLQTRHIESISYLSAELMQAFPEDRYEVTLVYLESGVPSESDRLAHECIFLNLKKEDYKGLRLRAMGKLKAFFRERQFDVIIANMYKPVNLLMQLRHANKASLCIGIIHTFGEFDRLGRRLMMRWLLEPRWKMVGVSQPVRDYLINANCGLHLANTLAINNAINVAEVTAKALDKAEAREYLKLPAGRRLFGTVGRCVKGKRHLELVKAFHQVAARCEESCLVVIGDGDLHHELVTYVNEHQLQNQVYLIGYLPQAVNYLRALDVFVFPSESEGFSVALLEAMALSLPTIVNQIAALTTVIADPESEVDSADIDALGQILKHFSDMPAEYLEAKGAANFARVHQLYDIGIYRNAYRELVDNFFLKHFPEGND